MQTYQQHLLAAHQQQLAASQQQQQQEMNQNQVGSFMARLLSLSQQELQCLRADAELANQLKRTQHLMECRLQLAASQQQQQHQHQQQQQKLALQSQMLAQLNQQQQQQPYYDYYAAAAMYQRQQQQGAILGPPALDLRTQQPQAQLLHQTNRNLHQQTPFNPKKLKLSEYQQQVQQLEHQQQQQSSGLHNLSLASELHQQANARLEAALASPACSGSNTRALPSPAGSTASSHAHTQSKTNPGGGGGKKYKGEFDEPTASEVRARQQMLTTADNYHRKLQQAAAAANGYQSEQGAGCACVLGSEFHLRHSREVLDMIDRWANLEVDERNRTKWDVCDLPKDIPLADIKKFEDLRREASSGRADFGGASKRKPLGIRGTRQFLLILYCLWGHPGREDPMQKEGYCPHCFAKIKRANEQSTLVRVVNHFNMKHRRGANPRLSPHRDSPTATAATCSTPPSPSPANNTARAQPDTNHKQQLLNLKPAQEPATAATTKLLPVLANHTAYHTPQTPPPTSSSLASSAATPPPSSPSSTSSISPAPSSEAPTPEPRHHRSLHHHHHHNHHHHHPHGQPKHQSQATDNLSPQQQQQPIG